MTGLRPVSDTTILLDIYERMGAMEVELRRLTKDHDEIYEDVAELKEFKSRVAAYIWIGGSVASGVLFFLYEGIKYILQQWLHQ